MENVLACLLRIHFIALESLATRRATWHSVPRARPRGAMSKIDPDSSMYALMVFCYEYLSTITRSVNGNRDRAPSRGIPNAEQRKGDPDHSPTFRIIAARTSTSSILLAYDHFNPPPWSVRISSKAPSPSCKTPPSRPRPLNSVWPSSVPRTSHRKRSIPH